MKQLFLALVFIAIYTNSYSQKITYQVSFSATLSKAKESNKPAFITIELPTPEASELPPNARTFKSGLEDAEVAQFYNKHFINYKINITDSSFNNFKKRYPVKIDSYPTYIFLDSGGELMHKDVSVNTNLPKRYIDMGQTAIDIARSGKTISAYKKLQQKGNISQDDFKQYITLRQTLGLYNNPELLDEYVSGLTVQTFNNYQDVLFILKSGPIAYGKTYNLCYSNRKIIDSIYKTEPLETRKAINNRIILNTRNQAILKKDAGLAQQLSNYVRGTWTNDYRRGNKASAEEMLYYYQAVKDTANYYRQATYFYDTYYMSLSADSIKKLNAATLASNQKAMLDRIKQLNPGAKVTVGSNNESVRVSGTNLTPVVSNVTSGGALPLDVPGTLNNAAYYFYTSGTRNANHLTKALLWTKRSLEVAPDNHATYDTMAHLLYRLGFIDEAITNQKKAIELAGGARIISSGSYLSNLKKELVKMQERTL